MSTLSLGPISFGTNRVVPPPGLSTFAADVDLRPAEDLIVSITGSLDPNTGLLTWHFISIDPATGNLPVNPAVGFLPPDVNPPQGEGSVLFTVMPKQGLGTGTQITNQATITFDVNAPINTPTWLNTLDNTPPTSHVLALPSAEPNTSFTVSWSGSDVGAGIQDFTIYVSDNSAAFTVWQQNTEATSATFAGQSGHKYGFYSIARDLVGNIESAKTSAEAATFVGDTTPPVTTASLSGPAGNNGWYRGPVMVTLSATDPDSPVVATYYSLDGGARVAYSAPFTVSTDGVHQLSFYSTDPSGNQEKPNALTIKIDSTPPAILGLPARPVSAFGRPTTGWFKWPP